MKNANRNGSRSQWANGNGKSWLSKRMAWPWLVLILMAGLLVLGARVAWALNYAGNISVNATMGQMSPNAIRVGDTAAASLSASYNQPSNVPEGTYPTADYSWSVAVEYKPLYADSYGAPPTNSYTLTISPSQPSSASGATMSFTPLIAGYWQFTGTCGVTLTDQAGNEYWTGSGTSSPVQAVSYQLQIDYGGVNVDGRTQDVSVGEYIPLMAVYAPNDMHLHWGVAGKIISGYVATNEKAVIKPVPASDYSNADITFYWLDTDGGGTQNEGVTLGATPPGSEASVLANTTFNVYRPKPTFTTQYLGPVALDSNYLGAPGELVLHDGDEAAPDTYDPGIAFYYYIPQSAFGGTENLSTVQLCSLLTVTTVQYNAATAITTTFGFTLPDGAVPGPLLDTVFPYPQENAPWISPGQTSDSPDYAVDPPPTGSGFGPGTWSTVDVTVGETFQHDLLFTPTVSGGAQVNYAPLAVVGWGWNGDAYNGPEGASGFVLKSANQIPLTPPSATDLGTLPQWADNAASPWGDPQWTPAAP